MMKRNSSIEVLKIIAMMMIVLSHSAPIYGDNNIAHIQLGIASNDITIIIFNLIKSLGHLGNIIFVVCSVWFLLESNKTKGEKVLNIILDSFTISVLFIIPTILVIKKIPKEGIISQFFPIIELKNWFVACYLLLYLIHPFLNIIIKNINQKQLLITNIVIIILHYGIEFIIRDNNFYFNSLIGFIDIYLIVAYVKFYLPEFQKNIKLNKGLLKFTILLNFTVMMLINFLGLYYNHFTNKVLFLNNLSNPLYVLIGITLLNIFNNKKFYNKKINYISSLSLIFYLIHENELFRGNIKPLFYQKVFPYGYKLFWVLVEALILIVGGLILSVIYKETLGKVIKRASNKLSVTIKEKYSKVEDKLLKIK